jgi:hypothetical protein
VAFWYGRAGRRELHGSARAVDKIELIVAARQRIKDAGGPCAATAALTAGPPDCHSSCHAPGPSGLYAPASLHAEPTNLPVFHAEVAQVPAGAHLQLLVRPGPAVVKNDKLMDRTELLEMGKQQVCRIIFAFYA